jgi:hypothetical protein
MVAMLAYALSPLWMFHMGNTSPVGMIRIAFFVLKG